MEHYPSWAVEQVWGSDRFYHEGDVAEDQYAFVIDSGVDLLDDLNVVEEWSRSWVPDRTPFDSGRNNHGTRVASIIGAKANYEGLTGVAPGTQIVSLKALNDYGWGSNSRITAALEYARDMIVEHNLFDRSVVNLSLGGNSVLNHDVIEEMADMGIKVVVAAGNSSSDVDGYSPAGYGHHENVYTITSTTQYGTYSGFTNFDGLDINGIDDTDFSAPGSSVPVYDMNGEIRNGNGTSFSAPMVSGILLMSDRVKPGDVYELSEDQIERGMVPDPLAHFDPYTYKHGERPEGPTPEGWYDAPPESFAPRPEPIVIEVPGPVVEVPGPVVEVPVPEPYPVPVPEPYPVPVPEPYPVPVPEPYPVPVDPIIGDWDESNRIIGTTDDDAIYGGMLSDIIKGGKGNDTIVGFGGDDILRGGQGDDLIFGGQGGKTKMSGGMGADTFFLNGGEGHSVIKDFDASEDRFIIPFEYDLTYGDGWTKMWVEDDLVAKFTGIHLQLV
jgi:Ca2+-binding RTX toxin-like protein